MKKLFIGCLLAIIMLGCDASFNKEVDISKKQERNGIVYVINSDKPFSGKMIGKYSNGQIEILEKFKDGKLNGEQLSYYENGQIKEKATFENGTPIGEYIKYYSNGTPAYTGKYEKGIKEGEWNLFDKDGKLLVTKKYEKGEIVDVQQHVIDINNLKTKIESLFN